MFPWSHPRFGISMSYVRTRCPWSFQGPITCCCAARDITISLCPNNTHEIRITIRCHNPSMHLIHNERHQPVVVQREMLATNITVEMVLHTNIIHTVLPVPVRDTERIQELNEPDQSTPQHICPEERARRPSYSTPPLHIFYLGHVPAGASIFPRN